MIAAAVRVDPEAVEQMNDHYSGYMVAMSVRKSYDQSGNACFAVDEDIRCRLETKLTIAIQPLT